ncbi:chorismate mutase [Halothermothrix orenii]|uniref:chorismate mutase n=1 Tax=Halothermothrix orenii (strain H 168 / OCM 544 / DSM 9562) TaxID=373903 RepID=B8CWX1_HALOH|nr:chorismate mutase [Halothermothrix orenii]ACL69790.1 chorismate mutase [Halothermothrix orenii H 168]
MRGIRGAITVDTNTAEDIINSTRRLLSEIINENHIQQEEIVSIIFTATEDLDQEYPAVAAREMGYNNVPLLCLQEMNVTGSLSSCLRVLIHINRNCSLSDIKHVYLKEAKRLRPDLVNNVKKGRLS